MPLIPDLFKSHLHFKNFCIYTHGWVWWIRKCPLLFSKRDCLELVLFICLLFFKCYFRERERECAWGGEGQRENPNPGVHAQCRARPGAQSHNPGVVTWAENQEPETQPWATQAPLDLVLILQHLVEYDSGTIWMGDFVGVGGKWYFNYRANFLNGYRAVHVIW